MGWTIDDVEFFKTGLTAAQKKRWVKIANAQLKMCTEEGGDILDCEVHAIRAANNKFADESYNLSEATCSIEKVKFGKNGQLQEVTYQEAEITDDYQMIFPIGLFNTRWYGEIIVTKTYIQMMYDNWEKEVMNERKPFVDEMHRREKAFGWIQDLQVRDDGLYAKIEWTPLGVDAVTNKIYKYFSADIDWHINIKTKEEYYPVLAAVSLCNTPVMNTMDTVHLSEQAVQVMAKYSGILRKHQERLAKKSQGAIMGNVNPAHSDRGSSAHSDGTDVSYQENFKMPTIEELLKQFGELNDQDKAKFVAQLTEILDGQKTGDDPGQQTAGSSGDQTGQTASGAQTGGNQGAGAQLSTTTGQAGGVNPVEERSKQLDEKINKLMADIQAASNPSAKAKAEAENKQIQDYVSPKVLAMLTAQAEAVNQLSEKLNQINAKNLAERKERLFDEAIKTGRIIPAKRAFFENLFDKNPDGIEEIINNLPASKIFSTFGTGDDGKKIVLNEKKIEKTVREGFGLTAEDMEKFGDQ